MESAVQCPVCTLYLHEGMALSAHLDTHPKDQVISALCNLAVQSSSSSTISTPAPSQSSLTFSTSSLSSTPVPPAYSPLDHGHRNRPRAPYTPVPPPSSTSLSFSCSPSDHPVYFLPQAARAYSRHGDNSFVLNNKFPDNDGLIMAFVQPPMQEQEVLSLQNHQDYDRKTPMHHLVMPVKTPQPLFYKQLAHQINTKKYAAGVPVMQQSAQDPSVVVVVEEGNNETPCAFSNSSADITKGDSNTCSSSKSGVKILSNVKVELPIQSIPDVIDLTSTQHKTQRPDLQEDEAILPDFVDEEMCHSYTQGRFRNDYSNGPSIATSTPHKPSEATVTTCSNVVNTFSVIKNIGNPSLYKDTSQHSEDNNKGSDNSILPDLTCNENPSISPCSELTNDSNEGLYDRIASGRALRLPTTPVAMYQNRFSSCDTPTSAPTSLASPKSNLFDKKQSKTIIPPSNSVDVSLLASSGARTDNCDNVTQPQDSGRLDGFFKDFERKKHSSVCESPPHHSMEQSKISNSSSSESKSIGSCIDDEASNSCANTPEERSVCSLGSSFNSSFKKTLAAERSDHLKNLEDDCAMGVDKLIDNLTQKSYTEMENMRPVNVIAFGSMLPGNCVSEAVKPSTSYQELTNTSNKYTPANSVYGQYFNKEASKENNIILQWEAHAAQKEEFALSSFMEIGQPQYTSNGAQTTTDGVGLQSYTELVSSGPKQLGEEGGRGELSEHDTPWPGMYCDVGGSTSYDLLARETWHSDGSDVDMPLTPIKDTYNDAEDIPIVVGVKPPERNYRCGTCGKTFNCPKERRVHRAKEHPLTHTDEISALPNAEQPTSQTPPARKNKKKAPNSSLLKPTQIKNEIVKTEISATNKLKEEVSNVSSGSIVEPVGLAMHFEDKKPKIEDVLGLGEAARERITKKRKRDWACSTCKEEFPGQEEYNQHLKVHPLECLTCGKYFYRRSNMQLHIKRHLGIKNYKCEVCEKRFITKQKMLEHYYVHTGNTPIKCAMCPETFRRYSNMAQHRDRHHFLLKKKLKDYVCHCGEVFHTKKKLAWHKEVHEDRPKACPHCSEKFIHAASLSRHVRRAHNTLFTQAIGGNAECTVCHQVYLRSSLESHMRTHAGARPYSCHICNKSFTTKWNLKLHRWTHANRSSKPYKCSLCKGAFIRHADYISHMNSHKSVRPYTCNYCGCQFIRKYNCQRHVKEHENDKKFTCQVADCGKSFHRSYYLAEHMRVHSGHRPYACNICGKTSSTKSNHNKHVKIHHAREPVTTEG